MQLRKVCNHPDLFESRPIVSPFVCDVAEVRVPSLVFNLADVEQGVGTSSWAGWALTAPHLSCARAEYVYSAFDCHRAKQLQAPRKLIEEILNTQPTPNAAKSEQAMDTSSSATKSDMSTSFFLDASLHGLELSRANQSLLNRLNLPPAPPPRPARLNAHIKAKVDYLARTNRHRCLFFKPIYGTDLRECVGATNVMSGHRYATNVVSSSYATCVQTRDYEQRKHTMSVYWRQTQALGDLLTLSTRSLYDERANRELSDILDRFVVYVPHVRAAHTPRLRVAHPQPSAYQRHQRSHLVEDISSGK